MRPLSGPVAPRDSTPPGQSTIDLVSALVARDRSANSWTSPEDARQHVGRDSKHLQLGLFLLQGLSRGLRVFNACVSDGDVATTLPAYVRAPMQMFESFGVNTAFSNELVHWAVTLQLSRLTLDMFSPVGAHLLPVSMPAKSPSGGPASSCAVSHERAIEVAKFLGLLYSVLLGEAFKIHVDLLYSVAANFEWPSDLYEIYVRRSLQAKCDCVSEFKRWVNKAGPSPSAFADELALFDEYDAMTDCFRQKILVPLIDASGPTSYLVRYLKDQQRRSEHMQCRSAALYEAKMFSARGPTGSKAAPQPRGPPHKAPGGAAAPANTRAKGGPTPVDAGSSFPMRTLTSL